MATRMETKIGAVIYTETIDGIAAEWVFGKNDQIEIGTGEGIRLSSRIMERRFEGQFEIIYRDSNGSESPKLNLDITFNNGCYTLIWSYNGKTTEKGIGIEKDGKLFASYTEVV